MLSKSNSPITRKLAQQVPPAAAMRASCEQEAEGPDLLGLKAAAENYGPRDSEGEPGDEVAAGAL